MSDTKESFLANETNKQDFIHELSNALQDGGVETHLADGDADCLIVVQPSRKLKKNPLLLLDKTQTCLFCSCSISNPNISTCFSLLEIKCGTSKQHTVQGADICTNILFGHANGGCDTTSSSFSIGKRELLLQLKNSPLFQQQAEVFAT